MSVFFTPSLHQAYFKGSKGPVWWVNVLLPLQIKKNLQRTINRRSLCLPFLFHGMCWPAASLPICKYLPQTLCPGTFSDVRLANKKTEHKESKTFTTSLFLNVFMEQYLFTAPKQPRHLPHLFPHVLSKKRKNVPLFQDQAPTHPHTPHCVAFILFSTDLVSLRLTFYNKDEVISLPQLLYLREKETFLPLVSKGSTHMVT